MTIPLTTAQRYKEKRSFYKFILIGLLGSVALHLIAMSTPTPGVWRQAEAEDDEMVKPEVVQESEISPEPQAVALADIAPPPIPLAPDPQTPQPAGEDAPALDNLQAITSKTGDTAVQRGGGPVASPNGTGDGYGFNKIPFGFNRLGKPEGSPQGQPGGVKDGKPGGVPGGAGTQTSVRSTSPPPKDNPKLVCLKCPKPEYRGSEGQPKVTYDIAPDGQVINVRLRKSSGNPDTDRETMETMGKWKFDPKTVPEGGRQDVKVRVTFEEEGSKFQRQNEQRRIKELQRREVAEQEQKRREALQTPVTPAELPTPVVKNSAPAVELAPASVSPAPDSAPAPAPEPPSTLTPETPPLSEPATVPANSEPTDVAD
jgi:TonB family protein